MKRFTFLLLFISSCTMAQKMSIKGMVVGPNERPLPSATIILLNPTDSSLVNFGVSKTDGGFELKNISRGSYLLKVTFVGHKTYSQTIEPVGDQPSIDVGIVKMPEADTELDEVVIQAEKPPVQVKGDTIEFNASSFKTKQNDNVEELLKKLPGVEVDNDGTIKAQGEQVQKVTVDGREFFGRDPKLATRNLPADAIDKVQVFDKKSDQAEFTGIDDGEREKTINLELKEEKRNGIFGSVAAGVGTDGRWKGNASLNRFHKGQQLSFIGLGNNVNEQGFSIEDYLNYSGGLNTGSGGRIQVQVGGNGSDDNGGVPLNMGGRQNGLMRNYAAGLNFSEAFSKKTTLSSSYFFNQLTHALDKSTDRISYYPNQQDLYYNENSTQVNDNTSHRLNVTLEHKIDSANAIKLTSYITHNKTDVNVESDAVNRFKDGTAQNKSVIHSRASGEAWTLNNNFLYRHKFGKKGRTFSSNIVYSLTDNDTDGILTQDLSYYVPAQRDSVVRQRNVQQQRRANYGINFSYTEPLGGRKYLEVNYAIRNNDSHVNKEVFDVANGNETNNDVLSNHYFSRYQYQRAGANLKINRKNYTLTAGATYQFTDLNGELKRSETRINKSFNNILPSFSFNYSFTSAKRLNFNYETSVEEPTIQELSPVVDNSNAFNIYIGNPNLSTAYNHRWMLNYMGFNPGNFISFFARANATYTTNAIVNAQYVDQNYTTTTQPVNLGNTINTNGNLSFGFPIKKIESRVNLSANARHSRNLSLLNDVQSTIRNETVGGNIRYEYRYKEILDINLGATLSHQYTRYDDPVRNQSYTNQTYRAEGNLTFLKNYILHAGFDYLVYANQTGGNNQRVPLLDLALSRYVLKAKTGEIKFAVVNLLDKSLGVTQTASNNYVEREVMNSLGRYIMVSFTYALNRQLNPMGTPGGRGMRMMMIRD